MKNNKSLGQHWLKDRSVLETIVDFAEINNSDTVFEIGPGLGTLTSSLLRRAKNVIAIEFDPILAANLPAQFPGTKLEVVSGDIMKFNLTTLPVGYKVVANLPYYITSKIIRLLLDSSNPPASITILIQKEVAERIAQIDGGSVLGIAVENQAIVKLGMVVLADKFIPPPKVDSQLVRLDLRPEPLESDGKRLMRVVKAGFSAKRKKLRSSLAGGLGISKAEVEELLANVKLDPNLRAENLSFKNWQDLTQAIFNKSNRDK